MTLGTIGVWRGVLSTNIWSGYRWTAEKAALFAGRQLANEADDTALIFRVRYKIGIPWIKASPAQEWLGLGAYHERLIAVTKSDFYSTEVAADRLESGLKRQFESYPRYQPNASIAKLASQSGGRLEFVGKVENFTTARGRFLANPRMLRFRSDDQFYSVRHAAEPPNPRGYGLIMNNCHDHAFAVLESLGLRRSVRSYFW